MKKFFVAFAMIMASMITMAQSQFYVILKDGTGTSFPEAVVDSLTFEDSNGAKIYGFEDIVNRIAKLEENSTAKLEDFTNSIAQLRREIDSLKGVVSNLSLAEDTADVFSHEYVDLGLPSGTLWATCNLGAKKPSEYGFYICWGETDQKSNYPASGGKWDAVSIETMKSEGVIDMYLNLTDKYDAATVLWGDDWRMPTTDEFEELLKYCAAQWSEVDGVNGIIFTSTTNSESIFLPCSGMKKSDTEAMVGTRAYYVGATATDFFSCSNLYLAQGEAGKLDIKTGSTSRSHGRTIRAVRKTGANNKPFIDPNIATINDHRYVDLGLPSGTLWATTNIGAVDSLFVGSERCWAYNTEEFPNLLTEYDKLLAHNYMVDSKYNLIYKYDFASQLWGAQWRTPTIEECEELRKSCKIEFVEVEHYAKVVSCCKLTGPNGNVLYLPYSKDFGVQYWSSTASSGEAITLLIKDLDAIDFSSATGISSIISREELLPIRPVVNR